MEKDKKIEQLIKEYGLESPPEDFAMKVMERIHSIPEQTDYKPLIGRYGRLSILIAIISIITVSIIYSEPSGFLSDRDLKLPQWDLNMWHLPELNFSTGLVAALMAVFILVVADSLIKRRWSV